ncbi:ABC transporter ATP-binding protein [Xanthobacter sp. AM11]|uniref:ABC transporter ATP-binding protein n=1 Tax=Xanthobacter TaxID=279 RepID=UPI0024AB2419|nr:ABC transporter ATP-binding protein [Xanthobacter autotrophicus]MDI4665521.1 ATP-binding cassette domain-containing protein [Xanthobacter autotrophicus]
MTLEALVEAGPVLGVDGVSYAYGARKVLSGVSFAVRPGQFHTLLGLNGAGKTTLISLITGLFHTRTGHMAVMGHDIARTPIMALTRLGIVFQARTLDPDLTVLRNLAYHGALRGLPPKVVRARALDILERFALASRRDDPVRTLSGGQQRRVEIARALIHEPSVLVLDEPTAGLDPAARTDIVALVRALVAERGLGVLWTTHLFDEIVPSDAVTVLHQGRVLFDGIAQELAQAGSLGEGFRRLTERVAP